MPIFDSDDPDGTFWRVLKLGGVALVILGSLLALLVWLSSKLKDAPAPGKKPGKSAPAGR